MGPGRRPLGVTVGGDRWWPLGLAAGPVRGVRPREGAVGDTSKGVCLEGDCSSYQVRFSVLRVEGFPSGLQPYFKRFINGNNNKKISNVFKSV